jgi:3-hydroxybutyryl-CoA dehydrogenase
MKLENVDNIAIVGTGMIGASVAAMFTGNGYRVAMYAINDKEAESGLARFRTNFNDLIAYGLVTRKQADACEKLLSIKTDYRDIADADFVYECIIEDKAVKFSLYAELEKRCKKARGIASSSSAMDTDMLCDGFSTPEFKALFAAAHPWNPPHLVPCVEVVKGKHTGDDALKFICDVLESCGRAPVVMHRSIPGFVANRLQHAIYREAAYMVEQGIATPQDIDRALQTSFVPRYTSIGIFEHFDYAGLDMVKSIEETVYPSLCRQTEPHKLINDAIGRGDLGYKTGKGILDWSNIDINEFRKRGSAPYLKFFNWSLPE